VPLCFVVLAQWIPPALGQFDLQDTSFSLKFAISKPFFMELIMLTTWSIWITRNEFIFKAVTPSVYRCRERFKNELGFLVHKAMRKSYHGVATWIGGLMAFFCCSSQSTIFFFFLWTFFHYK
jgi:hypothetical protein